MSDAPMNAEPRLSLWCHANPDKAAEEIERLRDALGQCIEVLDSAEMTGVWGFLYAHGMTWTGKVLDMNKLRSVLTPPLAVTPAESKGP